MVLGPPCLLHMTLGACCARGCRASRDRAGQGPASLEPQGPRGGKACSRTHSILHPVIHQMHGPSEATLCWEAPICSALHRCFSTSHVERAAKDQGAPAWLGSGKVGWGGDSGAEGPALIHGTPEPGFTEHTPPSPSSSGWGQAWAALTGPTCSARPLSPALAPPSVRGLLTTHSAPRSPRTPHDQGPWRPLHAAGGGGGMGGAPARGGGRSAGGAGGVEGRPAPTAQICTVPGEEDRQRPLPRTGSAYGCNLCRLRPWPSTSPCCCS